MDHARGSDPAQLGQRQGVESGACRRPGRGGSRRRRRSRRAAGEVEPARERRRAGRRRRERLEGGASIGAARGWAREHGIHVARRQRRRDRRRRRPHLQHLLPDRPLGRDRRRRTARSTCSTSRSAASATRSRRASSPGDEIVSADVDGVELGMTICYDLRFCELYRILAVGGARIFTVPSAFTLATGRDHWEVLLRARAIENAAFVDRPEPVRRGAAPLQLLRPLGDRRPLGGGARAGPRRRGLRRRRPRPRRAGAACASRCQRSPTAVPRPTAGPTAVEAAR